MREIEVVKDNLGHYADASPKVTQGIAEVLSANRAIERLGIPGLLSSLEVG